MKVFISWSGDESRQIAEVLRDWLPMAVHAARPYMSARDNQAGVRWADVIAAELGSTDFGLLCLTPTNLEAPWVHFEAGALGKAVTSARVVPLLWNLEPSDIAPPISQFQMKSLNRDGMLATVQSVNQGLAAESRVEETVLKGTFDALWPSLDARLEGVSRSIKQEGPRRSERQVLEEILELVRQSNALNRTALELDGLLELSSQDPWYSRHIVRTFERGLNSFGRKYEAVTGIRRLRENQYGVVISGPDSLPPSAITELRLLAGQAAKAKIDVVTTYEESPNFYKAVDVDPAADESST